MGHALRLATAQNIRSLHAVAAAGARRPAVRFLQRSAVHDKLITNRLVTIMSRTPLPKHLLQLHCVNAVGAPVRAATCALDAVQSLQWLVRRLWSL